MLSHTLLPLSHLLGVHTRWPHGLYSMPAVTRLAWGHLAALRWVLCHGVSALGPTMALHAGPATTGP